LVDVSPLQPPAEQPTHAHPGTFSHGRLGVVKLSVWAEHRCGDLSDDLANERAFVAQVRPSHPNIVRYLAVTDDFLFMEYLPLGTLQDYLKPNIQYPVLRWSIQLCSALVYLHDLGYGHSQVFPCNVLVASGGDVLKLCDFGTATLAQDFASGSYPRDYQALLVDIRCPDGPEVRDVRGDLCDVYSLGLLIWLFQHGGEDLPANWITDPSSVTMPDGTVRSYNFVVGCRSHNETLDLSNLFWGILCGCASFHRLIDSRQDKS
jgi:serine/threonine protein kinase